MNSRGGKAFLDTGTTFVYVSQGLFNSITPIFNHFCRNNKINCGGNFGYQECYRFSPSQFAKPDVFFDTFPVIEFKFAGDATIKWYPQDYFVATPDNKGYYCIGIKVLKDMILGALFMRNYDVSYEKAGKKITFMRSNCGKTNNFIPYDKESPPVIVQSTAIKSNVVEQKIQQSEEKQIGSTFSVEKPKIEENNEQIITPKVENKNEFKIFVSKQNDFLNEKQKNAKKDDVKKSKNYEKQEPFVTKLETAMKNKSKTIKSERNRYSSAAGTMIWVLFLVCLIFVRTVLFFKKREDFQKKNRKC